MLWLLQRLAQLTHACMDTGYSKGYSKGMQTWTMRLPSPAIWGVVWSTIFSRVTRGFSKCPAVSHTCSTTFFRSTCTMHLHGYYLYHAVTGFLLCGPCSETVTTCTMQSLPVPCDRYLCHAVMTCTLLSLPVSCSHCLYHAVSACTMQSLPVHAVITCTMQYCL